MNFWLSFKAAVCGNLFVELVVLAIAMDTVLGCLRAARAHKWNSSVGIDGGIRKAGMLVSVLFLVLVDMLLGLDLLQFGIIRDEARSVLAAMGVTNLGIAEFFCIVYIMYEATSILKNMLLCGLPCPKGLKEKLAAWLDQMTDETQINVSAAVADAEKKNI